MTGLQTTDNRERDVLIQLERLSRQRTRLRHFGLFMNVLVWLLFLATFLVYGKRARDWSSDVALLSDKKKTLEQDIAAQRTELSRLELRRRMTDLKVSEYIETVRPEQEHPEASKLLEEAISGGDEPTEKSAATLWQEGYTAFQEGNIDTAKGRYEDALRKIPTFAPALNSLGVLKLREELNQEAAELFKKAIAAGNVYGPAIPNLGHAEFALGNVAEAMFRCAQSMTQHPVPAAAKTLEAKLQAYGQGCTLADAAERFHKEGSELLRQEKTDQAMAMFKRGCKVGGEKSCARLRKLCFEGVKAACD
jgi:tetratricopeptide (TPR) repeat protein